MKVTVIIPTLNEEHGIGPTIEAIDQEAFAALGHQVEILVVDGDSKDGTKREAEMRGATVLTDRRKGYGRAYKTGFEAAPGDIIVTGDADGTYPFDEAHLYVQRLLDEGLDFLTCDRYADLRPGAMSRKHRFGNWVLSTTAQVLYFTRLRDSQSGMWVFRRSVLEHLPFQEMSDGMPFSQQIKLAAAKHPKVRAKEVPGRLHVRIGEPVIMSYQDGLHNLASLFRRRVQRGWMRR